MTKAYSLLELLVVIAIVALLAAILFPVFASVKREAKRTTCVSNLHQTGLAIGLYQAEANDLLPVGEIHSWRNFDADGTLVSEGATRDVIRPLAIFVKTEAAMGCPLNDQTFLPRWVVNVGEGGDRLMVPDASNVLTQCMHHLRQGWRGGKGWETIQSIEGREGNHLALRGDLSVGMVDAKSLRPLAVDKVDGVETWRPARREDSERALWVFASEKWSPEWVRLPEKVMLNWGRGGQ